MKRPRAIVVALGLAWSVLAAANAGLASEYDPDFSRTAAYLQFAGTWPTTWTGGANGGERWPMGVTLDLDRSGGAGDGLLATDPSASVGLTGPERTNVFFRSWMTLTAVEFALLGVTAALPRDWTGWSSNFIADGLGNMEEAYTNPPVWDTDWWFHNYVGHPYGGSVYYNTVRCQGASRTQSFLFGLLMSTQWEYVFESFAEQPSIQDLIITPVAGRFLGEIIYNLTLGLVRNGSGLLEKIFITILNPTYVLYEGF